MLVLEKTNAVGMLKSLGAKGRDIIKSFYLPGNLSNSYRDNYGQYFSLVVNVNSIEV